MGVKRGGQRRGGCSWRGRERGDSVWGAEGSGQRGLRASTERVDGKNRYINR